MHGKLNYKYICYYAIFQLSVSFFIFSHRIIFHYTHKLLYQHCFITLKGYEDQPQVQRHGPPQCLQPILTRLFPHEDCTFPRIIHPAGGGNATKAA